MPAFDLEGYVRAQSGIVITEDDRGTLGRLLGGCGLIAYFGRQVVRK